MSTFSVVCGTRACNANCPFCISKQTAACSDSVQLAHPEFDFRRFDRAIHYVRTLPHAINTALITGRGEPTLFWNHLLDITHFLFDANMLVELQTNGLVLSHKTDENLDKLLHSGMTTICLSVCSFDNKVNSRIMGLHSFHLQNLVKRLVNAGFSVRLTYLITNVEHPSPKSPGWFVETVQQAKDMGALQITFRTIGHPDHTVNFEVAKWVRENADYVNYSGYFDSLGTRLRRLDWGGIIYDYNGMSVCCAECITDNANLDEPRSYIFDGKHLRFSWQYPGAIIF